MIKVLLILSFLIFSISDAKQIILVVADDFNTSVGKLSCYEDSKIIYQDISVNLGRNGIAWGINEKNFKHQNNEPTKHEGDGKSPAGLFIVQSSFGYENNNFLLPYTKSDPNTICVDDTNSSFYNQIIQMPLISPKSFEPMKRDDDQYKIGIVVEYNPQKTQGAGSCIFLHVEKSQQHPTAGCTSMSYKDLYKILQWLDPKKEPIFILIPRLYLNQVAKFLK